MGLALKKGIILFLFWKLKVASFDYRLQEVGAQRD